MGHNDITHSHKPRLKLNWWSEQHSKLKKSVAKISSLFVTLMYWYYPNNILSFQVFSTEQMTCRDGTIEFVTSCLIWKHGCEQCVLLWLICIPCFFLPLDHPPPAPYIGLTSFLFWFGYHWMWGLPAQKNGRNSQSQCIAPDFMPALIIDSVYWNLFSAPSCLMAVCWTKTLIIMGLHGDQSLGFSCCGEFCR